MVIKPMKILLQKTLKTITIAIVKTPTTKQKIDLIGWFTITINPI